MWTGAWYLSAFKTVDTAYNQEGEAGKKAAQPVHKSHGARISPLSSQPVFPGVLIHDTGAD